MSQTFAVVLIVLAVIGSATAALCTGHITDTEWLSTVGVTGGGGALHVFGVTITSKTSGGPGPGAG